MSSIVFIYFLALLLLVCANTSKTESLELEDGELDFLALPSWTSEFGSKVLVNVDSLGAVGDGISDDTKVHILLTRWINSLRNIRGYSCCLSECYITGVC